ncbi:fimbrial protein [Cupriavidus sp. D384]|uniref:fimbrial protein n=1 Tax=Cupriavidus sp. D384 TaxID=1538095 RepID=UPI001E4DDE84|nr:fimbrial protein [Cupriavidus sp. D384]
MKHFRTTILAASLAVAAASQTAFAADGTITFTGRLTTQTCTISGNGGNNNFTVALPTISTSALATAGNVAGRTPFTFRLTGCAPNTGNVSIYFEPGGTIDTATGRLRNTVTAVTGSGNRPAVVPAGNVQIGVLNANMTDVALGSAFASQNSQQVALAAGSATLQYYAQYVATGGAATAGTFSTTATYSVVYP